MHIEEKMRHLLSFGGCVRNVPPQKSSIMSRNRNSIFRKLCVDVSPRGTTCARRIINRGISSYSPECFNIPLHRKKSLFFFLIMWTSVTRCSLPSQQSQCSGNSKGWRGAVSESCHNFAEEGDLISYVLRSPCGRRRDIK